MTKQEYIAQQYGKAWDAVKDYVDENGWVLAEYNSPDGEGTVPTGAPTPAEAGFDLVEGNDYGWRADNLRGIEDNNGWIKVEDRLPENDDLVIVLDGNAQYEDWYNTVDKYWENSSPTHWRPKIKYLKPLY